MFVVEHALNADLLIFHHFLSSAFRLFYNLFEILYVSINIFWYPRPKGAFHTSSARMARVASRMEPYFPLQMQAKPDLAHRLQTSKMRRNSTSLSTCQHDINIVTLCDARRRC